MTARKLYYIDRVAKIVTEKTPPPTLRPIADAVAEFYDVTFADLIGRDRRRRTALPRHVTMLLAYEKHPEMGVVDIARQLERDHSTVIRGIRRLRAALERDEEIRYDVDELRAKISA